MKNIILSLLLIIFCSAYSFAYDVCIDGICYNLVLKAKRAEVTYKNLYSAGYSGSIEIPEKIIYDKEEYTVTSIGENAFIDCPDLTSVTIPASVTSICNSAFHGCSGLTSFTIPNSVTSIGGHAFQGCSRLSITIPKSVNSIGEYAFRDLVSFIVDTDNPFYSSQDNILFNKNKTILISCCENKTGTYIIPYTVTTIGKGAFSDLHELTSIVIPNSVTTIGEAAFTCCYNLTSVIIHNS